MSDMDQRSTRITATGAVTTSRTRLHSIWWTGIAGVGTIAFSDGVGGTVLCTFDIPAGASGSGQIYVGEVGGILFRSGLACSTITAGLFVSVQYT